jgi:hypothetical protein
MSLFSEAFGPTLSHTQPPVKWLPEPHPRKRSGRGIKLTIHLHLFYVQYIFEDDSSSDNGVGALCHHQKFTTFCLQHAVAAPDILLSTQGLSFRKVGYSSYDVAAEMF